MLRRRAWIARADTTRELLGRDCTGLLAKDSEADRRAVTDGPADSGLGDALLFLLRRIFSQTSTG